jgi:hypothetical protein
MTSRRVRTIAAGTIYISGTRRVALHLSPEGRVALQVPHAARPRLNARRRCRVNAGGPLRGRRRSARG